MMTADAKGKPKKKTPLETGVEYRATIRFPRKDYEFMQELIKDGEYTNVTEIVRDAVKRFRLEWRDMEAAKNFMPMGPMRMMGRRMMPRMKWMRNNMGESDEE